MQTASNGITATIGDIAQGNNNGTTTLLTTASASTRYSFDLNGLNTSASGSNNAGAAARIGALATGASGSAYFQFTFTPTGGDLSVTEIGFGPRSTSTGPQAWSLRSDADAYASDLVTGALTANSNWGYRTATFGSSLNVLDGATRTFRLFGYSGIGSATANTANWRIDDLQVSAVPEPSTLGFAGVGVALAGLGAWKRRAAAAVLAG